MLKTWDVQPEATADGSVAVRPTPSQVGLPEAGGSSDSLALALFKAEAARLRELYVEKLLTLPEFDAALLAAMGHARCRSVDCVRWADFLNDHGYLVCARCWNAGCRCPGCEADAGWADYKDRA
jgi:hypothetical protein